MIFEYGSFAIQSQNLTVLMPAVQSHGTVPLMSDMANRMEDHKSLRFCSQLTS
jgi:hypothetical protein